MLFRSVGSGVRSGAFSFAPFSFLFQAFFFHWPYSDFGLAACSCFGLVVVVVWRLYLFTGLAVILALQLLGIL